MGCQGAPEVHSKPAAGFKELIPAVEPLARTPLGFGSGGIIMPLGIRRASTPKAGGRLEPFSKRPKSASQPASKQNR